LIKAVKNADVLIPRGTQPVPRKVITANSNLREIANYGVGYDDIDVRAATEFGIPVTNTSEVLTETRADLAWALLMATARKIPQAHDYTLSGQWKGPGVKTFVGNPYGTKPEETDCLGCMQPDPPKNLYGFCKEYKIRNCVKSKGYHSCRQCKEWPCNMHGKFVLLSQP
jgi:hypothetical protein